MKKDYESKDDDNGDVINVKLKWFVVQEGKLASEILRSRMDLLC